MGTVPPVRESAPLCVGQKLDGSRCGNPVRPPDRFCYHHERRLWKKITRLPLRSKLLYLWVCLILGVLGAIPILDAFDLGPAALKDRLRPLAEINVRPTLQNFSVRPPSFAYSKTVIIASTKPHLALNSGFGMLTNKPFNKPDPQNPTIIVPYVMGHVYLKLVNTGAPATHGNFIILHDDLVKVSCGNCQSKEYRPNPEGLITGISIPFELPDERPLYMDLKFQHNPADPVFLRFEANSHEILKNIKLGYASIKDR